MLGAEDIAALTQGGIDQVIVARLEPDEIDENIAAARLAQAVARAGSNLQIAEAFFFVPRF